MKKIGFSILMVMILLLSIVATVAADEETHIGDIQKDSHKIKNKWDLVGTYAPLKNSSWTTSGWEGEWAYEIHIKQAMYGPYSKGVITFTQGDKVITAHVEDVKENFSYWGSGYINPNIGAVGWAEYNGEKYNFMFLYAEGGIWIILSHDSYDAVWEDGEIWGSASREYKVLLAPNWAPTEAPFDYDPHIIHE